MGTIRQRTNGTFELRVVHRALQKPYYSTHDSREDAAAYSAKLEAALDRGEVPRELQPPAPASPSIDRVLSTYLDHGPVAVSDRPMVEMLRKAVKVNIDDVTVTWVDSWIEEMRLKRLVPGSIRKRVESLARAVDWWNRREHRTVANPLRTLPKGFSNYPEVYQDPPADAERDRRLLPGEAERIEAAILGEKRPDRERPLLMKHREEFLLLWRVIVNTALRLREAYTLEWDRVKFELRTLHIHKSKTGKARDVPMTPEVFAWLKAAPRSGPLVFPSLWSGRVEDLRKATNRLSAQFATLFDYAGCEDLQEHDLRHEATCRWMLMKDSKGRWLFRPEEVRRITGHKNVQQFERYLSLRGSDLAERLYDE